MSFIKRKAVFLVLDNLSWNVFSKTGDIETYLLMKELESQDRQSEIKASSPEVHEERLNDLDW
ncbi:YqzL family protein [Halobacillus litoralis]|uniref:YqzL family protein n=1 Tax=Halobacillus litoralis TaxID=45668 RepID=UPI001CD40515|nr:YqzL family protein [Halobacillus litoralis]MCA0970046.1 YqzL family protein [Halobacillus litoralis]